MTWLYIAFSFEIFFLLMVLLEFIFKDRGSGLIYNPGESLVTVGIAFYITTLNLISYPILYNFYSLIYQFSSPFKGSFNLFSVLLCIVIFDFVYFLKHWVQHQIPLLWLTHATHHQTQSVNLLASIRNSTVNSIFLHMFTGFFLALLGFHPECFFIANLVFLNWGRLNHMRFHWPEKINALLEHVIVTPRLHLIHHLAQPENMMSNYGTTFVFWDKIFGTYNDSFKELNKPSGLSYFHKTNEFWPSLTHEYVSFFKIPKNFQMNSILWDWLLFLIFCLAVKSLKMIYFPSENSFFRLLDEWDGLIMMLFFAIFYFKRKISAPSMPSI